MVQSFFRCGSSFPWHVVARSAQQRPSCHQRRANVCIRSERILIYVETSVSDSSRLEARPDPARRAEAVTVLATASSRKPRRRQRRDREIRSQDREDATVGGARCAPRRPSCLPLRHSACIRTGRIRIFAWAIARGSDVKQRMCKPSLTLKVETALGIQSSAISERAPCSVRVLPAPSVRVSQRQDFAQPSFMRFITMQ